jgi:phasin
MNDTANPTASDQTRKNYRDATPDMAVPEAIRAMAEKTVDHTREVYDRSKDTLGASFATVERTFDAAGQGAVTFNRKVIDIAQRNVNSGFDLAKSLAGAKNLSEMVELQVAYGRKLFATLPSQAEELRTLSTKVVADAGQATRGAGETRRG